MAVNQAQPHPQRTETRLTFAGRSFCAALDQTIWGAATLGRRFSKSARARQRGVEVIKNVPYRLGQSIDHRLDVYRTEHGPPTGRPAMLYIHGGGFALCSKDTHWSLALECARLGFVVFNINYRRSSKHPFPAAINDAILALRWVLAQGDRFGADPRRMVIAGESAGGNLTTALAVACSYRLKHRPARALFDTGFMPKAFIAACPVLQISAIDRFWRSHTTRPISGAASKRILKGMQRAYIGLNVAPGTYPLADPLVVLEQRTPDRPLPPALTIAAERDFLIDDSRRLKQAMDRLGSTCALHVYPGEHHVFHALPWSKHTVRCWKDQRTFLQQHVFNTDAHHV